MVSDLNKKCRICKNTASFQYKPKNNGIFLNFCNVCLKRGDYDVTHEDEIWHDDECESCDLEICGCGGKLTILCDSCRCSLNHYGSANYVRINDYDDNDFDYCDSCLEVALIKLPYEIQREKEEKERKEQREREKLEEERQRKIKEKEEDEKRRKESEKKYHEFQDLQSAALDKILNPNNKKYSYDAKDIYYMFKIKEELHNKLDQALEELLKTDKQDRYESDFTRYHYRDFYDEYGFIIWIDKRKNYQLKKG